MRKGMVALLVALVLPACSGDNSPGSPAPSTDQGFPNEGIPTTTRPKVAVARLQVGQTAQLSVVQVPVGVTGAQAPKMVANVAGQKVIARMAVTRVKTSSGDEFDKPKRGIYLGIYVKLLSLVDGLASKANGTVYVTMRGHRYGDTFASGFEPGYEFTDLSAGEAPRDGWCSTCLPATVTPCCLTASRAPRSPPGPSEAASIGPALRGGSSAYLLRPWPSAGS